MQVMARTVSAFQAGHEGLIPFAYSNEKVQPKPGITPVAGNHQEAVPLDRARSAPSGAFPPNPARCVAWQQAAAMFCRI
jgi:hypothetical protein